MPSHNRALPKKETNNLASRQHSVKNIVTSHPSLMDGNLTIYFETDATRKTYQDMPLNHPKPHLPYQATNDDDRGG